MNIYMGGKCLMSFLKFNDQAKEEHRNFHGYGVEFHYKSFRQAVNIHTFTTVLKIYIFSFG